MIHRNGDLFTTDAKIIAHGANTKGVMGAGVAKTIKEKFPKNYEGYVRKYRNGLAVPGEWYANAQDDGRLILNLYTQNHPGRNAKYELVFHSVMDFLDFYSHRELKYGSMIAIPEIGCGIGGLQWKNVEMVLKAAEFIYPEYEFEVWHYESN